LDSHRGEGRSSRCRPAFGDVFLDHERQASWSWWLVEQLADQLARQVVGDVAGDQLAAVGKGPRNVETENVGLHDLDVFVAGYNVMQCVHQATVLLNLIQPSPVVCLLDGQDSVP